jgi:P27 family predicted phage terminase small subunit
MSHKARGLVKNVNNAIESGHIMPGPKPMPTAIKELRGNPGHRPLPKNEPRLPTAVPVCPADLAGGAKRAWTEICAALSALQVLTSADVFVVEVAAVELDRYRRARTEAAAEGEVLQGARGCYMNPRLNVALSGLKRLMWALSECGLTPAARTRVKVQLEEGADPFEEFLQS